MDQHVFTVSDVNEIVRYLLETAPFLQNIQIKGEVSNFTRQQQSGHWYFSIKDDQNQLSCVFFKNNQLPTTYIPKNGDKVKLTGSLTVYKVRGQFQLQVSKLIPEGIGDLLLAYELLKQKLSSEGLFDTTKKKPIPVLPKAVGIVTSATGAALQDMLKTIQIRFPAGHIVVSPALVQGQEAPKSIINALEKLRKKKHVEVVILGRGGGSIEDLWAFNSETLVRYLANFPKPVVTGIGHETDFTLCDFVADFRASTPTAAAQKVYPEKQEIIAWLNQYPMQWTRLLKRQLSDLMQNTDYASEKLKYTISNILEQKLNTINLLQSDLNNYDLNKILKRGFSISLLNGKPIKDVKELEIDTQITTVVANGAFESKVSRII